MLSPKKNLWSKFFYVSKYKIHNLYDPKIYDETQKNDDKSLYEIYDSR